MYKPTLMIGLGGTGREVLLRVRRRFLEAGCSVQPWISYLWIDTAVSIERDRGPEEHAGDYFTQMARFDRVERHGQSEVCDIGISREEVEGIRKDRNAWKNIWSWADQDLFQRSLQDAHGLTQGAKQNPPLGRMAAFARALSINGATGLIDRLSERLSRLLPVEIDRAMNEALNNNEIPPAMYQSIIAGAPDTSAVKVIVAGSLAGGTGAGLCVDIAGMLRARRNSDGTGSPLLFETLDPLLGEAEVWGYFLLPGAFLCDPKVQEWEKNGFDPQRVRANGYAMLQEIEALQIRRSGEVDVLSGRRDGGRLRATWRERFNPPDDTNCPVVPAPLYHGVMLFDGRGFNRVTHSYDLVARLLYNDLAAHDAQFQNVVASSRTNRALDTEGGHLETVPAQILHDRFLEEAKWGTVLSFAYGSAGCATVTYEAPRLRLMATYQVAADALQRWLGPARPFLLEKDVGTNASDRADAAIAGRLRDTVRARLKDEVQRRKNHEGQRWVDAVREDMRWPAYEAATTATSRREAGFASALDALKSTVPEINSRALADRVREDWVVSERVHILLRALIHDPLYRETADEAGPMLQGGLAAAVVALGVEGSPSELLSMLRTFQADNERRGRLETMPERIRQELEAAENDAAAKCQRADALVELHEGMHLVTHGTRQYVEQTTEDAARQAGVALKRVAELLRQMHVARIIAEAFKPLVTGNDPAAQDLLRAVDQWKKGREGAESRGRGGYIAAARTWLEYLLGDDSATREGLLVVLRDMRTMVDDPTTRHLGADLQRKPDLLRAEILRGFDSRSGYEQALRDIQNDILAQWGAIASQPTGRKFDHLVDLAQRNDYAQEANRLEAQVNRLINIARTRADTDKLLSDRDVSQDIERQDDLRAHLRGRSELGLAVSRTSTRSPSTFGAMRPYNLGVREKTFLLAPRNVLGGSGFDYIHQADAKLEVRFVRFEHDLPICFTQFASDGFNYYRAYPHGLLHFQHPKAGYLPIHTLSESEAVSLRDRCSEVILAVLLGQLRPDIGDSNQPFRFVWHFDQDRDTPVPLDSVQSLGEVILYFETAPHQKRYNAMRAANAAILADMHVRSLVALWLLIQYNLRWTVGEHIEFDLDRAGKNRQEAQLGPAHLVFHQLAKRIEGLIAQHHEGGPFNSTRVREIRAQLEHFLHHFARFVPISLAGWEQRDIPTGKLLVLNVELVPRKPVYGGTAIAAADDMLLQLPTPDGQPELHVSMRAPWALYDVKTGTQTRDYHRQLAERDRGGPPTSMCPVERGGSPRPLPDRSGILQFLLEERHVRGHVTGSPFPVYKEFFKGAAPSHHATA